MLQTPFNHAYIIVGHPEKVRMDLISHLEAEHGIPVSDPNIVSVHICDRFYGDDAVSLIDQSLLKSDSKYIIISCFDATIDAQNKLLKTIEEPTAGTHIFLIVPSIHIVLPTIRSRVQTIFYKSKDGESESIRRAKEFLSSDTVGRLKFVEKIIDSVKDDEESKMIAVELIDGCTEVVYNKDPKNYSLLKDLLEMRSYAFDQSASLKYVLEWIALSLP